MLSQHCPGVYTLIETSCDCKSEMKEESRESVSKFTVYLIDPLAQIIKEITLMIKGRYVFTLSFCFMVRSI